VRARRHSRDDRFGRIELTVFLTRRKQAIRVKKVMLISGFACIDLSDGGLIWSSMSSSLAVRSPYRIGGRHGSGRDCKVCSVLLQVMAFFHTMVRLCSRAAADCPGSHRSRNARQNVLLITCDQWRGRLAVAGRTHRMTPNPMRLREGVLIRRHYAGAAPCSPAAPVSTRALPMNNRVLRERHAARPAPTNIALARPLGYEPTVSVYRTSPRPRFHAERPRAQELRGVLPGFAVRQMLPEHHALAVLVAAQGVDVARGIRASTGRPTAAAIWAAPRATRGNQTPAASWPGVLRWLGERDKAGLRCSFFSPHPPSSSRHLSTPCTTPPAPAVLPGGTGARGRAPSLLAWELDSRECRFPPAARLVRDLSEADFVASGN